jgi:hypothetical protein
MVGTIMLISSMAKAGTVLMITLSQKLASNK